MAGAAVAGERVYESLADVQVPPGVEAGSKFTVLMWAKRKGRRVAVRKELWAGSAASPAVQPREVHSSAAAKRHQLRPSGLARAAVNNSSRLPCIDRPGAEQIRADAVVDGVRRHAG